MEVINNKIVKATEMELYDYWLKRYDDIMSFTDFLDACKRNGTEVEEKE